MVKAVPEGYHNVTPYLVVSDAAKLLDFVKGFRTKVKIRMPAWRDASRMQRSPSATR